MAKTTEDCPRTCADNHRENRKGVVEGLIEERKILRDALVRSPQLHSPSESLTLRMNLRHPPGPPMYVAHAHAQYQMQLVRAL